MKEKSPDIKQLIRQKISEVDPDAEVILYGSRARGDNRKDSDWDILVLTDYPVDHNKEREFRNHIYNLELLSGESFSVFVYSRTDWNTRQRISPFYYNVMEDGIRL
jgi:predicted nucleotidyltransferase